MSEPNGNGALSLFAKARNWKRWTATNNEALLAIVQDEDAEEYRMLALAFTRAFGNWTDGKPDPQDVCLDPATGRRMNQADFAREIGVSKQTVSRWVERLEARNQLHDTGNGIYPVADPSKPSQWRRDGEQQFHTPGLSPANYKKIQEEYFREFPDRKRREDELRAESKALRYEFLRYYRERVRSLESGTNGDSEFQAPSDAVPDSSLPGSELQEATYIKERARADSESDMSAPAPGAREDSRPPSSSSSSSQEPPEPTTTTITDPQEAEAVLRVGAALRQYGTPEPDWIVKVWKAARAKDPSVTAEEVCHLIHEKAPARNKPGFQFFVTAVSNALPLKRDPKIERAVAQLPPESPEMQRWRAEQEAALADPNVSEQEKHLIRLCLGVPPDAVR